MLTGAPNKPGAQAFVAYVNDLRRDPGLGIIYVDPQLRPSAPRPRVLLDEAAKAPSLEAYVRDMGWMNPVYGQLRRALQSKSYGSDHERELLELNLQRARALPAGKGRFIVVNKGDFIGRSVLADQKTNGVRKKLIAFKMTGKSPPPRPHYAIWSGDSGMTRLGEVVSGTAPRRR